MTLIAVHGSATRLLPAERGTLHLSVRAEGDDRAAVVRQVSALHERLVAEATAAVDAGEATRWRGQQLQIQEDRRWIADGVEPLVVHTASAELRVRFRDFAALAAWSERVAAQAGVLVQRIEWALTDGTRRGAEREVRVEAVHDATARAEAYAAAIGGAGVDLQSLWEEGLRPTGGGGSGETRWKTQAMSRAASSSSIELSPDDIEVGATVSADFLVRTAAERALLGSAPRSAAARAVHVEA